MSLHILHPLSGGGGSAANADCSAAAGGGGAELCHRGESRDRVYPLPTEGAVPVAMHSTRPKSDIV